MLSSNSGLDFTVLIKRMVMVAFFKLAGCTWLLQMQTINNAAGSRNIFLQIPVTIYQDLSFF
jgi:hypothetical protein